MCEKIGVLISGVGYHQPGAKSIEIYCSDYGKRRSVKGKTIILSLLLSIAAMVPIAGVILFLLDKLFG